MNSPEKNNLEKNSPGKSASPARAAFSLIELMVVIAIIAILVGITTMVGSAVVNTGKKHATKGVIQSLDQALAAYIDAKGDNPPPLVEIPYADLPPTIQNDMPSFNGQNQSAFYPAIDGRAREDLASDLNTVNSVAFFIQSASVVAEAQEIISGIDQEFLQNYSADEEIQPFLLTAFDAWGNPIRYVHPKFDGIIERTPRSLAEAGEPVNIVNPNKPFFVTGALPTNAATRVRMKFVRRNKLIEQDFGSTGPAQGGVNQQQLSDYDLLPDSDGGLTIGNRPYFYSAGPDGDPSTIEDNIYSTTPQFADPGVL